MQPHIKPETFTISIILEQDPQNPDEWIIRVDEPANMSEVVEGDTIIWVCDPYHPFAVMFGYNSPLDDMGYRSDPSNHNVVAQVAPCAPFGRHKYFITACVSNKIVFSDPDIVVRPKRS